MQFTIYKITNKTKTNLDRELNSIPILGQNDLKITQPITYIKNDECKTIELLTNRDNYLIYHQIIINDN